MRAGVRAGLPRLYSSDGAQAHRAAAQVRPPKQRRNVVDPLAGVSLILYFASVREELSVSASHGGLSAKGIMEHV